MASHLVIGAGISSSGELELRAHVELSVQVGLMRFLRTVAGYLKSARVVAEEEMYAGWSLKRQRAWDAASMSERLRQVGINTENVHTEIPNDRVNICRLRAKWPQMEAFFLGDPWEGGGGKGRSESLASAAVFAEGRHIKIGVNALCLSLRL